MDRIPTLKIFDEPLEMPVQSIDLFRFTTVFAAGIVNPFGPTLTALILHDRPENGGPRALARVVYNPFQQRVDWLALVDSDSMAEVAEEILPYTSGWLGRCPTLVMPSLQLSDESSVAFTADLLAKLRGSADVLDSIRQHPGDPWQRVQAEMDNLTAGLEEVDSEQLAPSDLEARELADHLLDPGNQKAELQAFLYAWNGSIEFVQGSKGAPESLPLDACADLLARIAVTARLPAMDA